MAICELCGSKDFEEIYGMFYCKICNTLSQSQGIEQETTIDNANYHGSQLIKLANPFVSQKLKKGNDEQYENCRPWKTLEGFQFILKQQVEALIALGVQPEIKEIVFKIWVQYLRQTKQAFVPIVVENEVKERLRDKYITKSRNNFLVTKTRVRSWLNERTKLKNELNQEQDDNKNNDKNDDEDSNYEENDERVHEEHACDSNDQGNIKNLKLLECNLSEKSNKSYLSSNNFKLNSTNNNALLSEPNILFNQQVDNDDNVSMFSNKRPLDVDDDDDDELVPLDDDTDDNDDVNLKEYDSVVLDTLNKKFRFSLNRMNLSFTLSIIHVALLYFDSNILSNDILRLVKQNKLPFNACKLWPADMLFNFSDYQLFSKKHLPTPEQVSYNSYRLMKTLNLNLIKNSSFEKICLRFLLQLHLPIQIFQVVLNILSQLNLCSNSKIKSNFFVKILKLDMANLSMAIIIVALKLIFILDDHTENVLSLCADQLNSILTLDKCLFNWTTWFQQINKRVKNTSVKNMRDLDSVLSSKDLLKELHSRREKIIPSCRSYYLDERRLKFDSLLKSFEELMDKNDSTSESESENSFELPKNDKNKFIDQSIMYAFDGKIFLNKLHDVSVVPSNIITVLLKPKYYCLRPLSVLISLRHSHRKRRYTFGKTRIVSTSLKQKNLKNSPKKRLNTFKQAIINPSFLTSRVSSYSNSTAKNTHNKKGKKKGNKKEKKKGMNGIVQTKDFNSYLKLVEVCSGLIDCSQLRLDEYVQRIECKLFEFKKQTKSWFPRKQEKDTLIRNRFFPREKRKKKVISMKKLKVLLMSK